MKPSKRFYLVEFNGKSRLIRATHPAQAISHVAKEAISCRVPSAEDLVSLIQGGVSVEETSTGQ